MSSWAQSQLQLLISVPIYSLKKLDAGTPANVTSENINVSDMEERNDVDAESGKGQYIPGGRVSGLW